MLKWLCVPAFVLSFLVLVPAKAWSSSIIDDDFGGSALDSNWTSSLHEATGWTNSVTGGEFVVTDIAGETAGKWGGGQLIWDTPTLTDFTLEASIRWDTGSGDSAMQWLQVSVFDTDTLSSSSNRIGLVGYRDAWIAHEGSYDYSTTDSDGGGYSTYIANSGEDTLAATGTATVGIKRSGSTVTVLWNGSVKATYTATDNVEGVGLFFAQYGYTGSTFGTLAIDSLTLTGTVAVPEPGTAALVGMLLGGALLVRRRRRAHA